MPLFLVDAPTPGFSRGRRLEKIGPHASDTLELFYEDVRVDASQLLEELDQGFAALMNQLPRERWSLAVAAVAASEIALEWTVQYVLERQAFGAPLAKRSKHAFSHRRNETRRHRESGIYRQLHAPSVAGSARHRDRQHGQTVEHRDTGPRAGWLPATARGLRLRARIPHCPCFRRCAGAAHLWRNL